MNSSTPGATFSSSTPVWGSAARPGAQLAAPVATGGSYSRRKTRERQPPAPVLWISARGGVNAAASSARPEARASVRSICERLRRPGMALNCPTMDGASMCLTKLRKRTPSFCACVYGTIRLRAWFIRRRFIKRHHCGGPAFSSCREPAIAPAIRHAALAYLYASLPTGARFGLTPARAGAVRAQPMRGLTPRMRMDSDAVSC